MTSARVTRLCHLLCLPLLAGVGLIALFAPTAAGASAWNPQFPSPEAEVSNSALQGVSCAGSSSCMAVGYYAPLEGETILAFAERWNGSEWISHSVPQPAGANWAIASSVSCPSVGACMLAGTYIAGNGLVLPLAASWDGSSWALSSVPIPENALYAGLTDISCSSATECVAVGQFSKKNTFQAMQPYIVRWNGTKWTRQIGPLPAGGGGGHLYGVSCTSSSHCTAAGSFYSVEIVEKEGKEVEVEVFEGSLVDTWDGSKWKASQLGPDAIEDVSCQSAEDCMAVSHSGEAWMLSGSQWTEVEGPAPGPEAWFSSIRGVSCVSADICTAVGEYGDSAIRLYISIWDGAEWQLQTSVEPSETESGTLEAVSCVGAAECIAVGESESLAIAEHSE